MKIGIVGIGCTPFGELWEHGLYELLAQAQHQALADAQLSTQQIGTIITSNMCASMLSGQGHLGAMAAESIGCSCPSVTVEAACASGGVALRQALTIIEAGHAEIVMVNGVEKMTDVMAPEATTALMAASHEEYEHFAGATFAGLNALIARLYMQAYGISKQQLATVSIKNHKHATTNPLAHFQKEITLADYLKAPLVADPLSILDCSPLSDGATSLIICSQDFAKSYAQKHPDKPLVYIIGSGQATDSLTLTKRETLLSFKATTQAAQQAYNQAGVSPCDIHAAEVHDAFTIIELIGLEDLGLYPKGQAGLATEQGDTMLGGKQPVNVSGGLKAKGHPIGASGLSQIYELTMQLRGHGGKRQVPQAQLGLAQNMGGCGTTSVVHILSNQ